MPNVKSARSRIDEIDTQIFELLASRLGIAREVGEAKASEARSQGKKRPAILVFEREENVFRRLRKLADDANLPWPLVQAVFTEVISLCRAGQGKITAHVLGPAGTHSEFAARARFGETIGIKRFDSIPQVIRATEQALAGGDSNAVAIVPVENSLEGTVTATIDSLLATSLKIVSEGYYRVRHALLSRAGGLDRVKTVYSHPMGLAQCQRWLAENLPSAKRVEVSSTAEAAKIAASGSGESRSAAVASPYLAQGDLKILASDIQDMAENTTRFVALGGTMPAPTGDDKTSLVFSLPNKPGSLVQALDVFTKHKLNMTKIESRPHRGLQWEYLFYVDIDGHASDARVGKALKSFDQCVRYFKVLGTYPKGRPWN